MHLSADFLLAASRYFRSAPRFDIVYRLDAEQFREFVNHSQRDAHDSAGMCSEIATPGSANASWMLIRH
jgi:hypothetical protein